MDVPSRVMAAMQTTAISANRRPYSASVAPSSLPVTNLLTALTRRAADALPACRNLVTVALLSERDTKKIRVTSDTSRLNSVRRATLDGYCRCSPFLGGTLHGRRRWAGGNERFFG